MTLVTLIEFIKQRKDFAIWISVFILTVFLPPLCANVQTHADIFFLSIVLQLFVQNVIVLLFERSV